jgi:septin family protein
MLDLIHTTEEQHYENYRLEQMGTRKQGEARVKKPDNPKFKEEEEALRKRFTEQVKAEEARFRQWEQHVCPIHLNSWPLLTFLSAYCRARPPQQGFGNYPQLHKRA